MELSSWRSVINLSPLHIRPPWMAVGVSSDMAQSNNVALPSNRAGSPCICPYTLPSPHHTSWYTICRLTTTSIIFRQLSIPPATPVLMTQSGWKVRISATVPAAAFTLPIPHFIRIMVLFLMLPSVYWKGPSVYSFLFSSSCATCFCSELIAVIIPIFIIQLYFRCKCT